MHVFARIQSRSVSYLDEVMMTALTAAHGAKQLHENYTRGLLGTCSQKIPRGIELNEQD